MSNSKIRFLLLISISMTILLSACTRTKREEPDPIVPNNGGIVVPQPTVPVNDGKTPPAIQPEGDSTPDGTNPDGSTPDGTNPDGSTPDGTNPDGSTPDGTNPSNYTIVAGDTLSRIAQRFNVSVQDIAQANGIVDVNNLKVGSSLIIPVVTGGTLPVPGEKVHIVQAGENLYRIGLKYAVTVQQLVDYNNITNPGSLAVGQEIKVPPPGK